MNLQELIIRWLEFWEVARLTSGLPEFARLNELIMEQAPPFLCLVHLIFLDDLRETGRVNMFEARGVLSESFDLSMEDARGILLFWMTTYELRHPEADNAQSTA